MEELTGLKVRMIFNSNSGTTILTGDVIKVLEDVIVVKNNLQIVYVLKTALKMIQLVNQHEEA